MKPQKDMTKTNLPSQISYHGLLSLCKISCYISKEKVKSAPSRPQIRICSSFSYFTLFCLCSSFLFFFDFLNPLLFIFVHFHQNRRDKKKTKQHWGAKYIFVLFHLIMFFFFNFSILLFIFSSKKRTKQYLANALIRT